MAERQGWSLPIYQAPASAGQQEAPVQGECRLRSGRSEPPLVLGEWERSLRTHPYGAYRDYLLNGIKEGFRVGFQYDCHACSRSKSNMVSASKNPKVVEDYLTNEIRLWRVISPLELEAHPYVQSSRFGVIEKPHQPGKYRLMTRQAAASTTASTGSYAPCHTRA